MPNAAVLAPASLPRSIAPSPPGWPLIGHIPAAQSDLLGLLMRARETCGDIAALHFGPMHGHLLSHPTHIRHVLQDNHRNYTKQTRGYEKMRALLGAGLLTSEGDFWRQQRRLIQPPFHRQHLAAFADTMAQETLRQTERWDLAARSGETVDLAADMMALTLRIVGRTLLSADLSGDSAAVGQAMDVVLHELNRRIQSPWGFLEALPLPRNRRYAEAIATLDAVVARVIAARRTASGEPPADLLTLLLGVRDADTGEGMSDRQLRDEVLTLFLAGHETTANALAWAFHLLAQHPEIAERVRREADAAYGQRTPGFADVMRLPYTRQVVQESMRLYPPAWLIARSPIQDDRVGGYTLPAGSLVLMSAFVTQRHPDLWPEPMRFDPERFAPGRAPEAKDFAYFPFGGGPRVCIGQSFALTEAVIGLSMLVQRYDFAHANPAAEVGLEPLITLRPKGGLPMKIARR
jgi:cytochrome P450